VQVMYTYGYEIVQTLIVDIEPDEIVKRAMNEINAGDTSLFYLLVPQVAKMAFARSKCGSTLVIQLTRDSSNSLHAEFKKEFVDFK
jgi:hypothetical protein